MNAEEIAAVFEHAGNLKKRGNYAEAVEFLSLLAEKLPNAPIAHFRHAAMLARAGHPAESAIAYRRCLELSPDHPGALLGLGHVLRALGNYEECVRSYKHCIEQRPDQGEAYFSLANLKTYRFDDTLINEMETRIEKETLSDNSRVNFLFALGKAHEDLKDYGTAWKYYSRGNSAQRARISYDPVQTE
ncbi:MAG: tetratricopeptide (TPR) repeat protein, partial [Cryomorphaceae bacterium]